MDRLAEHYGIDVASVMRLIIKKEYDSVVATFRVASPTTAAMWFKENNAQCPCGSGLVVSECKGQLPPV